MPKFFEITEQPLSLDDVARRVSRPDCGAITTFAGVVRGATVTSDGVRGTDFLIYEAYVEMAEAQLARIGDEIQAAVAQGAGGEHPAPHRPPGDRRAERRHRRRHAPPRGRLLRRVPLRHRAAQGHRTHLEAGKLVGRAGVGGRASPAGVDG